MFLQNIFFQEISISNSNYLINEWLINNVKIYSNYQRLRVKLLIRNNKDSILNFLKDPEFEKSLLQDQYIFIEIPYYFNKYCIYHFYYYLFNQTKYQCNFDLNNIFCEIIKFSFEENIQKISDLYERNIDIKKIQEDLLDQLNENQTIKQNELFFQYLTINLKLNEEQILYRNTKKKILKFTLKLILSLYEFLDLAQTGDEKYETIENFISLLENKVSGYFCSFQNQENTLNISRYDFFEILQICNETYRKEFLSRILLNVYCNKTENDDLELLFHESFENYENPTIFLVILNNIIKFVDSKVLYDLILQLINDNCTINIINISYSLRQSLDINPNEVEGVKNIIYQFFDFGFQEENNNYLKYGLFLARCLCFSKNLNNFVPYDEWFNQFWLKYRDFYKIKLFWNLLIELVPYDTYDILSIQISKSKCTSKYSIEAQKEYLELARIRSKELAINRKVFIYPDSKNIKEDLDKIIEHYKKYKEIFSGFKQFLIFNFKRFDNEYLPVLLQPRIIPKPLDAKGKFIKELISLGKIKDSHFNKYKILCEQFS